MNSFPLQVKVFRQTLYKEFGVAAEELSEEVFMTKLANLARNVKNNKGSSKQ